MVDWNLDAGVSTDINRLKTQHNAARPSRKRGPLGIRKSRPLVEVSQQYTTYSGGSRRKQSIIKIKRAKRNEYGEVVRQ